MMRRFKNKDWYNNAIVVCTGVLFYVILVNFPHLFNALKTFIGYFSPVILGCVIAYIVNPLSVFLKKKLFPKAKGNVISNILAFLIVILFLNISNYSHYSNSQRIYLHYFLSNCITLL